MIRKIFTASLPFISRPRRQGKGDAEVPKESPVTLSFAPGKGLPAGAGKAARAEYKVRVFHSCELHTSRSLLALGKCSMYCTRSCMLADMQEEI